MKNLLIIAILTVSLLACKTTKTSSDCYKFSEIEISPKDSSTESYVLYFEGN